MKEQDIRSREVLNKYLQLVERDALTIFKDKQRFAKFDCPACFGANYSSEFTKSGFTYAQCRDCDTLFVTPRPTYENLMQFYTDSPSTKFWVNEFFMPMVGARREKIFKPRAEFITSKFPALINLKIADVGAGFGIFLEELRKIWPDADITAIEPSIDMAAICREKNINVMCSMVEDVDSTKNKFDLLTAFELFEHLHQPITFLNKANELLNEGGYLFFTTLNSLGFDIQLLWENSKSVFPPHHLNFFNPHSITVLLKKCGFKVVDISTPGQLDWDIVEGGHVNEDLNPGRFFCTVAKYGTKESKSDLQEWLKRYNFSSHMRVVAKKGAVR